MLKLIIAYLKALFLLGFQKCVKKCQCNFIFIINCKFWFVSYLCRQKLIKFIMKKNMFLIFLVLMVLLGYLLPYRESYNAYFNLGAFIDWGIVVIFLLYGLKLNLRSHLCTFPLFGINFLSHSRRYRVCSVMAFYLLFSLPALHRFIVGSDGFNSQRQCTFGYL